MARSHERVVILDSVVDTLLERELRLLLVVVRVVFVVVRFVLVVLRLFERVFILLLSPARVVLDVLVVLEFVVLLVLELVEFVFEFVVFDVEVLNLLKASVREAISF